MKALTIHAPWAPLIAIGEKQYETRSWRTNYRGPIAIHCSRSMDFLYRCNELLFVYALRKHGLEIEDVNKLRGQVIATAELVDCIEIDELVVFNRSVNELVFGDWRDGRFAWKLENVKKLETPVPAVGKQRLWNWEEHNEFPEAVR